MKTPSRAATYEGRAFEVDENRKLWTDERSRDSAASSPKRRTAARIGAFIRLAAQGTMH